MSGAAATQGGPAIDLAAGLERVMDDRVLFLRILGRFAGDYRDLAARLHAALETDDTVLAQRIVHTLKGAAGMIEAARLRQLALDAELALKDGGLAPPQLLAALDDELARALAQVDRLLATSDTVAPAASAGAHDLARLCAMLDTGDGRAIDLAAALRPQLLASIGSEGMAIFDAAIRRFDFEGALALLEHGDRR